MAMIPAIRSLGTLDTDGWFLLASGRVIVEYGIPRTNPFTAIAGQGIVIQQWLHDAWLYLCWKGAGYAGVAVSVAIPAALALWAYTGTVSRLAQNARYPWAPLLIGALGFTLMASYLSIRPSLWTAALLFVAISLCLEWRRGANKRLLFALPVVSLLSVNLQAALWPLPAAAAACFLLPEEGEISLSETGGTVRSWVRSRLPLLAAIAGMAAESLVNPYAIDGSLYVLRSLGAASYGGGDAGGRPVLVRCDPRGDRIVCSRAPVPAQMASGFLAGVRNRRGARRQVSLDNVDRLVSDHRRICRA